MALEMGSLYSLAILTSGVTLMIMGVVYAFGTIFSNPKLLAWVKTEMFQVVVTIVLVFLTIFLAGLVGLDPSSGFKLDATWMGALSEEAGSGEGTVYETADAYLREIRNFDYTAVKSSRAAMGAFDEYSRYSKQPCIPGWLFCLLGANGVSFQPLSGASSGMQVMNLLLYTSISSYVSAVVQLDLLAFIQGGMLAIYLPLAIIFRALPFIRPFGGGLLAICVSLFFIYPLLLFVESAFWDPVEMAEGAGADMDSVDEFIGQVDEHSGALSYGVLYFMYGEWTFNEAFPVVQDIIRVCSVAFLASGFLFAFNMIAIAASARAFGKLLGAEIDMSTLVQIV